MMIQFDARQVAPESNSPIPLDWYNCQIVDGEVKANGDASKGGHLALTLVILDGPQAGRKQIDRLNLFKQGGEDAQKDAKTIQIAQSRLSAYCHITGQFVIQSGNAAELFNKPFRAKIGPQKGDERYSEIKELADIQGNPPGKQGAAVNPGAQQAAPAGWGNAQQPAQQQVQQPAAQQQPAPQGGQTWGQPPANQQPQQWGQPPAQQQPAQQPQQPANNGTPAQNWGQPPAQQPAQAQQWGNPNAGNGAPPQGWNNG